MKAIFRLLVLAMVGLATACQAEEPILSTDSPYVLGRASRDGIGNRTSAMTFGPGKVFLLAGTQKIVPDLHAAFQRIREVAAPMRAKSLNMELPCTKGKGCVDCHDPNRICRATLCVCV